MLKELPELREEVIASEVRDRDSEMKAKPKVYADKKRNAKESDIGPADKVLVKQERQNKLSSPFAPEPHKVATKTGKSVVIESPDGVQLKRNNTYVKKYEERIVGQDGKTTLPVDLEPTESATEQEMANFPLLLRPPRVKKLSEKFKDFVMTLLFISEIVYCFITRLNHFTFSLENICTFGFPY